MCVGFLLEVRLLMCIIKVGSREDSSVYIRMKIRAASEVGIKVSHIQLPKEVSRWLIVESVGVYNSSSPYVPVASL